MDIKKKNTYFLVINFICILSIMPIFTISTASVLGGRSNIPLNQNVQMHSPEDTVIDKVYNLTVDRPYVKFRNITFQQHFTYYITVCVVTPHTCNLNMTLWDPEGTEFQLSYEENMAQNEYREVPYGVAIEGNYTIHFIAIDLNEAINIRITIEREHKVLYDKVDSLEQADIIYYNVTKFYDGTSLNHTLILKSDWYYKFIFSRVSPISKTLSNNVTVVHYILDETQGIPFKIYLNKTLASPKELTKYAFVTAIGGEYAITTQIYCNVTAINLAYAVVESHRITDERNPNDPGPDPLPDNSTIPDNSTTPGVEVFIPKEWTIGIIIAVGIFVGVPIILVIYNKKKNATGI